MKLGFFRTLVCCVAALCGALQAADGSLVLVKDGKSTYSICISEDGSLSEKRAPRNCSVFLEEISGAQLPIITDAEPVSSPLILVGNSWILRRLNLGIPFDTLGPEGFALRSTDQSLVIAGGRERGTMYGICVFLEKLGCRWFAPQVSRATGAMREYFDLLHGLVRLLPRGEGQHIWIRRAPHFSATALRKARELFRRAETAAENEAVRLRVRKARLVIDNVDSLAEEKFRDARWRVRAGGLG